MVPTLGERILGASLKIQNEIFTYCLRRTHHDSEDVENQLVPSLLAAFRVDKQLSRQALEPYYEINWFVFDYGTDFTLGNLRPSTAALIRNIDIIILDYRQFSS
jgi:hypothetical protein